MGSSVENGDFLGSPVCRGNNLGGFMHYYPAQPRRSHLMIGVLLCAITMAFLVFVFGRN